MPVGRRHASGAASPQHAHIICGLPPTASVTNGIDQFEYSTETGSTSPSNNVPYSAYSVGTISNSLEAIIQGGTVPSGPPTATSKKASLSFSDGTVSALPSQFTMGHPGDTGVTNSPFK